MEDIRDIKPLFQISDYSLLGLIPLFVIVLVVLILLAYKFFTNKDRTREESLKILENIDLSNPKEASYLVTRHGRIVVKEESDKRLLEDLIVKLEQYKYRKNISKFTKDIEDELKIFLGAING